VAQSHRHVQSARRFVVEDRGVDTNVDGERATMHPGDFIITPSWTWHEHGNEGFDGVSEPVAWLDGLDIPMVRFFDAGFSENKRCKTQPVERAEDVSLARFGNNMAPVAHQHTGQASPIFSDPYSRTGEALHTLLRDGPPDSWHGVKLNYIDPLTGGWPMPPGRSDWAANPRSASPALR
jgi:gentisate 1,2-dioxygenase